MHRVPHTLVAATVALGVVCLVAAGADPAEPRIVAGWEIAEASLAVAGGSVALGGISDLHFRPATKDTPAALWAVTDRGPNGVVSAGSGNAKGTVRTLLAPDFTPALVQIDASCLADRDHDALGTAPVQQIVPLVGQSGRPFSGRPNGIGRDEPAHTADGTTRLEDDPNGVDPEGVVATADGGFWVVEEHRPSILRVAADGRVLTRHVPAGEALPGADARIVDNLPGHFAGRADNRGFEAVALAPDAGRLFVLLQSPLRRERAAGEAAGAVPLLEFDAAAAAPVAEHRYVLDRADADGKLCAMACLDRRTLLVLEQADGDVKRLYLVDTAASPVRKTLVADLATILPAMRKDVYGRKKADQPLKIEGLAIVDERHVLLANDNDFGVADDESKAKRPPRNCLWLVELPAPLPRAPRT